MNTITLTVLSEKIRLERERAHQTVNDRAKQNKKLAHSKRNTPPRPRSRRATRTGRTGAARG